MGSVPTRAYHQYCGIAHAMELVGERWAMLVVRDLLLGPKRFTELRQGLPRIPSNILSARLKELEEHGIVRRRLMPRPATGVAYELTPYGAELEDVLLGFGRWGAQSLGDPHPDDIVTGDSLVLALRATFQAAAARSLSARYELRVGPVVIHAVITRGQLQAAEGPLPDADLLIDAGPLLKRLMAGEVGPADALASGQVRIQGDPVLLDRFVEVFRIAPVPALVS